MSSLRRELSNFRIAEPEASNTILEAEVESLEAEIQRLNEIIKKDRQKFKETITQNDIEHEEMTQQLLQVIEERAEAMAVIANAKETGRKEAEIVYSSELDGIRERKRINDVLLVKIKKYHREALKTSYVYKCWQPNYFLMCLYFYKLRAAVCRSEIAKQITKSETLYDEVATLRFKLASQQLPSSTYHHSARSLVTLIRDSPGTAEELIKNNVNSSTQWAECEQVHRDDYGTELEHFLLSEDVNTSPIQRTLQDRYIYWKGHKKQKSASSNNRIIKGIPCEQSIGRTSTSDSSSSDSDINELPNSSGPQGKPVYVYRDSDLVTSDGKKILLKNGIALYETSDPTLLEDQTGRKYTTEGLPHRADDSSDSSTSDVRELPKSSGPQGKSVYMNQDSDLITSDGRKILLKNGIALYETSDPTLLEDQTGRKYTIDGLPRETDDSSEGNDVRELPKSSGPQGKPVYVYRDSDLVTSDGRKILLKNGIALYETNDPTLLEDQTRRKYTTEGLPHRADDSSDSSTSDVRELPKSSGPQGKSVYMNQDSDLITSDGRKILLKNGIALYETSDPTLLEDQTGRKYTIDGLLCDEQVDSRNGEFTFSRVGGQFSQRAKNSSSADVQVKVTDAGVQTDDLIQTSFSRQLDSNSKQVSQHIQTEETDVQLKPEVVIERVQTKEYIQSELSSISSSSDSSTHECEECKKRMTSAAVDSDQLNENTVGTDDVFEDFTFSRIGTHHRMQSEEQNGVMRTPRRVSAVTASPLQSPEYDISQPDLVNITTSNNHLYDGIRNSSEVKTKPISLRESRESSFIPIPRVVLRESRESSSSIALIHKRRGSESSSSSSSESRDGEAVDRKVALRESRESSFIPVPRVVLRESRESSSSIALIHKRRGSESSSSSSSDVKENVVLFESRESINIPMRTSPANIVKESIPLCESRESNFVPVSHVALRESRECIIILPRRRDSTSSSSSSESGVAEKSITVEEKTFLRESRESFFIPVPRVVLRESRESCSSIALIHKRRGSESSSSSSSDVKENVVLFESRESINIPMRTSPANIVKESIPLRESRESNFVPVSHVALRESRECIIISQRRRDSTSSSSSSESGVAEKSIAVEEKTFLRESRESFFIPVPRVVLRESRESSSSIALIHKRRGSESSSSSSSESRDGEAVDRKVALRESRESSFIPVPRVVLRESRESSSSIALIHKRRGSESSSSSSSESRDGEAVDRKVALRESRESSFIPVPRVVLRESRESSSSIALIHKRRGSESSSSSSSESGDGEAVDRKVALRESRESSFIPVPRVVLRESRESSSSIALIHKRRGSESSSSSSSESRDGEAVDRKVALRESRESSFIPVPRVVLRESRESSSSIALIHKRRGSESSSSSSSESRDGEAVDRKVALRESRESSFIPVPRVVLRESRESSSSIALIHKRRGSESSSSSSSESRDGEAVDRKVALRELRESSFIPVPRVVLRESRESSSSIALIHKRRGSESSSSSSSDVKENVVLFESRESINIPMRTSPANIVKESIPLRESRESNFVPVSHVALRESRECIIISPRRRDSTSSSSSSESGVCKKAKKEPTSTTTNSKKEFSSTQLPNITGVDGEVLLVKNGILIYEDQSNSDTFCDANGRKYNREGNPLLSNTNTSTTGVQTDIFIGEFVTGDDVFFKGSGGHTSSLFDGCGIRKQSSSSSPNSFTSKSNSTKSDVGIVISKSSSDSHKNLLDDYLKQVDSFSQTKAVEVIQTDLPSEDTITPSGDVVVKDYSPILSDATVSVATGVQTDIFTGEFVTGDDVFFKGSGGHTSSLFDGCGIRKQSSSSSPNSFTSKSNSNNNIINVKSSSPLVDNEGHEHLDPIKLPATGRNKQPLYLNKDTITTSDGDLIYIRNGIFLRQTGDPNQLKDHMGWKYTQNGISIKCSKELPDLTGIDDEPICLTESGGLMCNGEELHIKNGTVLYNTNDDSILRDNNGNEYNTDGVLSGDKLRGLPLHYNEDEPSINVTGVSISIQTDVDSEIIEFNKIKEQRPFENNNSFIELKESTSCINNPLQHTLSENKSSVSISVQTDVTLRSEVIDNNNTTVSTSIQTDTSSEIIEFSRIMGTLDGTKEQRPLENNNSFIELKESTSCINNPLQHTLSENKSSVCISVQTDVTLRSEVIDNNNTTVSTSIQTDTSSEIIEFSRIMGTLDGTKEQRPLENNNSFIELKESTSCISNPLQHMLSENKSPVSISVQTDQHDSALQTDSEGGIRELFNSVWTDGSQILISDSNEMITSSGMKFCIKDGILMPVSHTVDTLIHEDSLHKQNDDHIINNPNSLSTTSNHVILTHDGKLSNLNENFNIRDRSSNGSSIRMERSVSVKSSTSSSQVSSNSGEVVMGGDVKANSELSAEERRPTNSTSTSNDTNLNIEKSISENSPSTHSNNRDLPSIRVRRLSLSDENFNIRKGSVRSAATTSSKRSSAVKVSENRKDVKIRGRDVSVKSATSSSQVCSNSDEVVVGSDVKADCTVSKQNTSESMTTGRKLVNHQSDVINNSTDELINKIPITSLECIEVSSTSVYEHHTKTLVDGEWNDMSNFNNIEKSISGNSTSTLISTVQVTDEKEKMTSTSNDTNLNIEKSISENSPSTHSNNRDLPSIRVRRLSLSDENFNIRKGSVRSAATTSSKRSSAVKVSENRKDVKIGVSSQVCSNSDEVVVGSDVKADSTVSKQNTSESNVLIPTKPTTAQMTNTLKLTDNSEPTDNTTFSREQLLWSKKSHVEDNNQPTGSNSGVLEPCGASLDSLNMTAGKKLVNHQSDVINNSTDELINKIPITSLECIEVSSTSVYEHHTKTLVDGEWNVSLENQLPATPFRSRQNVSNENLKTPVTSISTTALSEEHIQKWDITPYKSRESTEPSLVQSSCSVPSESVDEHYEDRNVSDDQLRIRNIDKKSNVSVIEDLVRLTPTTDFNSSVASTKSIQLTGWNFGGYSGKVFSNDANFTSNDNTQQSPTVSRYRDSPATVMYKQVYSHRNGSYDLNVSNDMINHLHTARVENLEKDLQLRTLQIRSDEQADQISHLREEIQLSRQSTVLKTNQPISEISEEESLAYSTIPPFEVEVQFSSGISTDTNGVDNFNNDLIVVAPCAGLRELQ